MHTHATNDERFIAAATKALEFIAIFVELVPGARMHNSRNTDYIVLYGIARFLTLESHSSIANRVIMRVLSGVGDKSHFVYAIDDRYLSHYIGSSMMGAAQIMQKSGYTEPNYSTEYKQSYSIIKSSGYCIFPSSTLGNYSAIVSMMKGGMITLWPDNHNSFIMDYGWRYHLRSKVYVTHWWNECLEIEYEDNERCFSVRGNFVPHSEMKSTPLNIYC